MMTVKELKDRLSKYPDDAVIFAEYMRVKPGKYLNWEFVIERK